MESSGSQRSRIIQAMDKAMDDLEYAPKSSSEHFQLFNAAYTGKLNYFKSLALDNTKGDETGVGNAIIKFRDEDKRGSLHFAASGGSLNICKYLLDTLKLKVDAKDHYGHTPLYLAAKKGHLDTVRYLLEMGANADASNDTKYTPLHCAAKTGDTKIITLLLSRGARVDVASTNGTALQTAACIGLPDAIKVLLDHGANPNVVTPHGMLRPLMSVILAKSWECVELLLQAGADSNAVSCGNTPLTFAARDGPVDVIKRLLEAGADPNHVMN
ncbi:hypothetical protein MKW94_023091, partial [Papaver nudicaule]|nr:hypothetical protein [Papaver nudicaule]